jgi:hypothetical protein
MDMAKVVVERFENVKKCFQSSNGWKFEANLERSKKVFKSPIWNCQKKFSKAQFGIAKKGFQKPNLELPKKVYDFKVFENLFNLGFQFQAF